MSTRSNEEIRKLKTAYKSLYDTELEADLVGDTSGYFRQLLVMQCRAERDESDHVHVRQAREGTVFRHCICLNSIYRVVQKSRYAFDCE